MSWLRTLCDEGIGDAMTFYVYILYDMQRYDNVWHNMALHYMGYDVLWYRVVTGRQELPFIGTGMLWLLPSDTLGTGTVLELILNRFAWDAVCVEQVTCTMNHSSSLSQLASAYPILWACSGSAYRLSTFGGRELAEIATAAIKLGEIDDGFLRAVAGYCASAQPSSFRSMRDIAMASLVRWARRIDFVSFTSGDIRPKRIGMLRCRALVAHTRTRKHFCVIVGACWARFVSSTAHFAGGRFARGSFSQGSFRPRFVWLGSVPPGFVSPGFVSPAVRFARGSFRSRFVWLGFVSPEFISPAVHSHKIAAAEFDRSGYVLSVCMLEEDGVRSEGGRRAMGRK